MNLAVIVDNRRFPFDWKVRRVFSRSPLVDKVISVKNKDKIRENLRKYNLKPADMVIFNIVSKSSFTLRNKIKESINDLNDLIKAAIEYGAAVFGLKVPDTLKIINDDYTVSKTLNREIFYDIQYPQAIRWGLFKRYGDDSCYRIDSLKLNNIKVIEANPKW